MPTENEKPFRTNAGELRKLAETARRGDIAGNGLTAILAEHAADLADRLDALEATVAAMLPAGDDKKKK